MSDSGYRITVGELRAMLWRYPDDAEITFGSMRTGKPLFFLRVNGRSAERPACRLIQIELTEAMPEPPL